MTLYLSYSQLSTYDACGERYRLRYVEQVPPVPLGSLIGGKAVHEVIEASEREGTWALPEEEADRLMTEAFVRRFQAAVEEAGGAEAVRWGGRLGPDGRRTEDATWWVKHAGPLYLRRYRTIRREDRERGLEVRDGTIEMEVASTIEVDGEQVLIRGYIDAVVYSGSTSVIRDWKTGTYIAPFQLAVYAWLLGRAFGEVITVGEIAYLRGASRDTWLRTYDLEPWIPLVPRRFADLLRGVRAGIYPMRPSQFCSTCVVQPICEYGRTITDA